MFGYPTDHLDEQIQQEIVMSWDDWSDVPGHLRGRSRDDTSAMLDFFKGHLDEDIIDRILTGNDQQSLDFAWQRVKYFLIHREQYRAT